MFAAFRDRTPRYLRVPVVNDLVQDLAQFMRETGARLLDGDPEQVPFSPGYNCDEDEVFVTKFELPADLLAAMENGLDAEAVTAETLREGVPAALIWVWERDGGQYAVVGQAFDRRQLLLPARRSLMLRNGAFGRMDDTGITLGETAHVAWIGGYLRFRSFHTARRIFDLQELYWEASSPDLVAFTKEPRLHFEDRAQFEASADSWIRKKVAILQAAGAYRECSFDALEAAAAKHGVTVGIHGTGVDRRIVVPAEKKSLKQLLKFLDDDLFVGEVSQRQFVTNSKRPR